MRKKYITSVLLLFLYCLTTLSCSNNDVVIPDLPINVEEDDEEDPNSNYDLPTRSFRVRDPFIYADPVTKRYYLHVNANPRLKLYMSKDLKNWKDAGFSFVPDGSFWGKSDFWAPDLYFYEGKYYLFVTFSSSTGMRGTSILISDSPAGPFEPLVNNPVTPPAWMALDGALYVDKDGQPWILYCHEWLQVKDGEIIAQKLSKDLKTAEGNPILLFKASEAPWTPESANNYVTDAPFIYELENGRLAMTWSSGSTTGKYSVGVCYSDNGVSGPWVHEAEPLNDDSGGHAMLFNDFEGNLKISYHAPNSNPNERMAIKDVVIENNKIKIVH